MNLSDNFVELFLYEDLSKLKNNWFKFKKFCEVEFNNKVPFQPDTDKKALEELDSYIGVILKLYPMMFPKIVLSTNTNTFRRNNQNDNKKLDEIFLKRLDEKKLSSAADIYMTKVPEKLSQEQISSKIHDEELADTFQKSNDIMTREVTIEMIFDEIFSLLQEKFSDIIPMKEKAINLARFIALELYLRTLVPEEYIYKNEYYEIDKSYDIFKHHYKNLIIEAMKKSLRNKTSHAVLEDIASRFEPVK